MEAVAKLNNCPSSPRKMKLVVDLIRGKNCDNALKILRFSSKHPAAKVEKTLVSAIHNWKALNEGVRIDESDLYIKKIYVDNGRMLKRVNPAPQGRAYRIRKRSNHVTLVVDAKQEENQEPTNK